MISAFNGQNNFTQEQIDLMQTWADDNLINGTVPVDPDVPADPVPTGTSYYFSALGNDANDGSIGSPKLSITEASVVFNSMNAGDAILFRSGDTFTPSAETGQYAFNVTVGKTGTDTDKLIISWYHEDDNTPLAKPILTDIRDVQKDFLWLNSKVDNFGNKIWTSTGGDTNKFRLFKDDVELFPYSKTYDTTSTEIVQYELVEFSQSNGDLLVKSETDPSGVYSFSGYTRIMSIEDTKHLIVNQIEFKGGSIVGAEFTDCDDYNIQNCKFNRHTYDGLQITGSTIGSNTNGLISYNEFDADLTSKPCLGLPASASTARGHHNMCQVYGSSTNVIMEYNSFKDHNHVGCSFAGVPNNSNHLHVDGRIRYSTFDTTNHWYGRASGMSGNGTDCEFAYNRITQEKVGSHFNLTRLHVHHNIWEDHPTSPASSVVGGDYSENTGYAFDMLASQGVMDGMIFENNIFKNFEIPAFQITLGKNTTVQNNICIDCDTLNDNIGSFLLWSWGDVGETKTGDIIRNNLVYSTSGNTATIAVSWDGDLAQPKYVYTATELNNDTLYQFQAYDNLEGDPLFVDTIEFRIPDNSPADDSGTMPLATIDFDGNPIGDPYDMGLYNNSILQPDNIYLEEMKVPDYIDSAIDPVGGATHFLFNTSHSYAFIMDKLQDDTLFHYYFEGGDYRNKGQLEVEYRSGTEQRPITVALYDPNNDLHPAKMDVGDMAQINIYLRYCEWWQLHRLASYSNYEEAWKVRQTSHVVINECYSYRVGYSCMVNHGAHYITVQKCRFDGYIHGATDNVAMNIRPDGFEYKDDNGNNHYQALYNKFISNEVANRNDGFQNSVRAIVAGETWQYGNVGGLIIYDNDFYVDYIYRGYDEDGAPLPDRGDEDMAIENAIDTKGGSPDPLPDAAHDNDIDNPTIEILMHGNRMWGYDSIHNDEAGGGGSAFIASMFTNGHKVYDNIIFDSNCGFSGGSNSKNTGLYTGRTDCEFYNNILYQCGDDEQGKNWRWRYTWREDSAKNHNMHDNYIIEPDTELIAHFYACDSKSRFQDNMIVAPKNGNWAVHCDFIEQTPQPTPCHPDFVASTLTTKEKSRTGFTDYVFITDKYTNNPRTIRLERILDPDGTIVSPL